MKPNQVCQEYSCSGRGGVNNSIATHGALQYRVNNSKTFKIYMHLHTVFKIHSRNFIGRIRMTLWDRSCGVPEIWYRGTRPWWRSLNATRTTLGIMKALLQEELHDQITVTVKPGVDLEKAKGVMPLKCFIVSYLLVYRNKVAINPRFLESKSSPSHACLESSPSLTGQDSNPSPAGFESESRCLWLESESESQGAEISQL